MLDSLNIVIEFGLGLAGFAGIVVALAGDPRNWSEGERVRVFGLIISALLACFTAFLCLTLAKHYSLDTAVRTSSTVLFILSLYFYPKQVLRTFYVSRVAKENYSHSVTLFLSIITLAILSMSFISAAGWLVQPLFLLYGALVLNLLFAATIYIRILLYRPAGAVKKIGKKPGPDS